MLLAGVDLKVISGLLGHSSIGITADLYLHVAEKIEKEAAFKLDGLIGKG
jgi:integrase